MSGWWIRTAIISNQCSASTTQGNIKYYDRYDKEHQLLANLSNYNKKVYYSALEVEDCLPWRISTILTVINRIEKERSEFMAHESKDYDITS
jgi:hypothetical protein